jgi:hypothetical protein
MTMRVNSTDKRKHSMIAETKYVGVHHKNVREIVNLIKLP